MAAEVSSMPGVNGYTPHQGYGSFEQQHHQQQSAYGANGPYGQHASSQIPSSSTTPAAGSSSQSAPKASQQAEIPKDEVGWYFVEQYYTTLSKSPEKLYLFYSKLSQFVSGQETDKVAVCVGQRAINDRIRELAFQDCKVRVTNVDSQASDSNIVIQVIGEISNQSQPHKKFVQTFVLATQTNGYFVLNDIFRYLVEEEDEPEQEQEPAAAVQDEEVPQASAPATITGFQEPTSSAHNEAKPPTLTSSEDPAAVEHDAQVVDKGLEEALEEPSKAENVPAAVNGVAEKEDDAPADASAEPEVEPAAAAGAESQADEVADVEAEKPQDPVPTPAAPSPAKQAPPQPAAPAKPAAPKTWATLAAAANRVATPAVPQPRPAAPSAKATTPTPAAAAAVSPPAASSAPSAPAAQQQEASTANGSAQDEWNTVGSSHNRQQSRQVAAQQEPAPQSRGYIKNVHENVDGAELRAQLEQFGEVTYFDVARQKNCAFVDFKTAEGYNAAVAANPHTIGSEQLYVEERRIRPGSTPYVPRGQYQGQSGRGRGGANQTGGSRGNYQNRGGYTPRGGRGGNGAPAGRGRGGAAGAGPSSA